MTDSVGCVRVHDLYYCLQVGAGVLALPAATLQAGALPSSLVLIAVWMYMCCTGLLIAEVNVNVMCRWVCVYILCTYLNQSLAQCGTKLCQPVLY
jgi:amino acid permease